MSSNSTQGSTTDFPQWVIDIRDSMVKVNATELDLENSNAVCICEVPESLSCSKKEAFIPQFVGLGPYHHSRQGLLKNKLKLAAAKRVLKDLLSDMNLFLQRISKFDDSHVQNFYHPDVKSTYDNNTHTLFSVLTVDGLFLLSFITLLSSDNSDTGLGFSYFLTGKLAMPFFNSTSGVELTRNALIREVFKLENQIPFRVLKQISGVKEIESDDEPMCSNVHNFCKQHCPLVKFQELPNKLALEGHHHLLDLMYHLIIVPKPQPEPVRQPESQINALAQVESQAGTEPQTPVGTQAQDQDPVGTGTQNEEAGTGTNTQVQNEAEDQVPAKVEAPQDQAQSNGKDMIRKCFSGCFNIVFFVVVACFVLGYIVLLILKLFYWVICKIFRLAKKGLKVFWENLKPVLGLVHHILSEFDRKYDKPFLKTLTKVVGNLVGVTETLQSTDSDEGVGPVVMIPSVTELHNAGISFQPAKSGISSIEFDDEECIFYLPSIRLDVNSDVIIRNLVAYETLIKSNAPLVFTKYVELMRAIIDTPADVKILVDSEIVKSELRDEAIANLFNGMSKSIRPTKTPDLDKLIHRVNAKFDSKQKQKRVVKKYTSGSFLTAVGGLLFLLFTALQTYCTVYNCSGSSRLGKLPQDVEYYGRSNYFISSM